MDGPTGQPILHLLDHFIFAVIWVSFEGKDLAARAAQRSAATGSTSEGSLFLTLPTRGLTGQQVISSAG